MFADRLTQKRRGLLCNNTAGCNRTLLINMMRDHAKGSVALNTLALETLQAKGTHKFFSGKSLSYPIISCSRCSPPWYRCIYVSTPQMPKFPAVNLHNIRTLNTRDLNTDIKCDGYSHREIQLRDFVGANDNQAACKNKKLFNTLTFFSAWY